MATIKIQFTLFSAFYTPLIATFAAGFLKEEGLDSEWSISPPGVSAIRAVESGEAHVVQSALSQGFGSLARGETHGVVHFAQVNEMDGFFITGREPEPDFTWNRLEDTEVVTFSGGQPLAMFRYACHKAGVDPDRVRYIHPGGAADIDSAFRNGVGRYVQQQGPFPQQLEADGIGHIVAREGDMVGPCGFSSLAADRDWLQTDMARTFMRAYRKTRLYLNETSAAEIAAAIKPHFPDIDEPVLANCLESYQQLGCWTPHTEITAEAFEAVLDVFAYFGTLEERYSYDQVCAMPPRDS